MKLPLAGLRIITGGGLKLILGGGIISLNPP